jgi:hypothetical protein
MHWGMIATRPSNPAVAMASSALAQKLGSPTTWIWPAPSLRLDLRIGNDRVEGLPGVAGGQLAVASTAIRAIPEVRAAPAGIVTAPVFGAYRFPDR